MDSLVRRSLVERRIFGEMEHFSTFPFVTSYARRLLTENDHILFSRCICEYFSKMSAEMSQMMGTENADRAFSLFEFEEGNILECLRRPAIVKKKDEDMSPTASISSSLLNILLFAYRADDGILAGIMGLKACRFLNERKGEANTLKALGDLKVRVDDLAGARRDYETALPIYREIQERLDEANTRQGLGNLLISENKFGEALSEFNNALKIHMQMQDMLGIGADLLYMGRSEIAAGKNSQAAMFLEIARSIYLDINDRWGQALALNDQADAFQALEAFDGMLAAKWQARQIFRDIQSPAAEQLDEQFSQLEENMGKENFQEATADLNEHADERRHEALLAVQKDLTDDAFLQEVMKAVSLIREYFKER